MDWFTDECTVMRGSKASTCYSEEHGKLRPCILDVGKAVLSLCFGMIQERVKYSDAIGFRYTCRKQMGERERVNEWKSADDAH